MMNKDFFEWNTLHKKLQDIMKQELFMLREVLNAMKEEEYALIERNFISKKTLGSKRCSLSKQLKLLQKERNYLTKALLQASHSNPQIHHFNSKMFNSLISQDEDNAVETFHLRDQILHLMKNIKQQKDRIACLAKSLTTSTIFPVDILSLPKQEDSCKKIQTIQSEETSI